MNLHLEGVRLVEFRQSDAGMLAKVANALGIPWYCVGDDDDNRAKDEPKLQENLDGVEEVDRFVFPYPNIEVNLLRNGFVDVYNSYMPLQNLKKITAAPGDPGYWEQCAAQLPNRAKTRAAAKVAIAMEDRGSASVPAEIRKVLKKVVGLSQGGHQ